MGGAFLVLGLVFLWRGHALPMQISGGLGGLLVLGGLLIPGRLGPVYDAWMALALAISKVTTPIFLGIVYYIVMAPMGLVRRLLGWNAMRHDLEGGTYWKDKSHDTPGGLTRQF